MTPPKKVGPLILTSTLDKPWTESGFQKAWKNACKAAGISRVTFNDLRGTAATRLALVECTVPQIVSITGQSLSDVRSILDAHCLLRDPQLAEIAIRKRESRTKNSQLNSQLTIFGLFEIRRYHRKIKEMMNWQRA